MKIFGLNRIMCGSGLRVCTFRRKSVTNPFCDTRKPYKTGKQSLIIILSYVFDGAARLMASPGDAAPVESAEERAR